MTEATLSDIFLIHSRKLLIALKFSVSSKHFVLLLFNDNCPIATKKPNDTAIGHPASVPRATVDPLSTFWLFSGTGAIPRVPITAILRATCR